MIKILNTDMKRNELTAAVRRIAEGLGYTFYTGPEAIMNAKVRTLPAVWMSPPVLKSASGKRDCRDVYRMKVRVMSMRPGDAVAAAAVDGILEADALELFRRLRSEDCVRRVDIVAVEMAAKPALLCAEAAVIAQSEVTVFYYGSEE